MFATHAALDAATAAAVEDSARRSAASDGVWPLNEAGRAALASPDDHRVMHWVGWDDDQVQAYAQLDERDGSVQLFVDPGHRMMGLGTDLVRAVTQGDRLPTAWWAFGNLPGARALAQKKGFHNRRELLIMGRAVSEAAIDWPERYHLGSFTDADLEGLHAVNSASFAGHPEQGLVSLDELQHKITNPAEILVARDSSGVAGFHWTKLHDAETGEVYVLAVHPDHAGSGLGRGLLVAGLNLLASEGATKVILYVEAANTRVVRLYENAGFTPIGRDVAYSR